MCLTQALFIIACMYLMSHMFTATANTLTCTCTCMGSKSSVCLSGLLNQLYGWKVAIDAHLYIELHSDTEIHGGVAGNYHYNHNYPNVDGKDKMQPSLSIHVQTIIETHFNSEIKVDPSYKC